MDTVMVSGGTRGIGRAISLDLHRHGYAVIAVYREREAEAQELLRQTAKDPPLTIVRCDVTDPNQVRRVWKQLTHDGSQEIVGLVNCAGTYQPGDQPEGLLPVLTTNVIGPYVMTQAFGEYRRQGGFSGMGAVVTIGSTSAWHGPTGSAIYAASKAGVQRLMQVLAMQYAREKLLHCNTIVCGPVVTELLQRSPQGVPSYEAQTPTGRLTTPEEVAAMARWLIEQRDTNLVGAEIALDGGRTLDYRQSPSR